jgi:hypothetical protein
MSRGTKSKAKAVSGKPNNPERKIESAESEQKTPPKLNWTTPKAKAVLG